MTMKNYVIKHFDEILRMSLKQLIEFATINQIKYEICRKDAIRRAILEDFSKNNRNCHFAGIIDMDEKAGYLRSRVNSLRSSCCDIHLPKWLINKYNLQAGDEIECTIKSEIFTDKLASAEEVSKINQEPAKIKSYPCFEDLIATYPRERIKFSMDDKNNPSGFMVDLLVPHGKGQRSLLVAPAKAGKTTFLHNIALGILKNHPEIKLIILLVGERPEEVHEMRRIIGDERAEIFASTFDEAPIRQIQIAERVFDLAKSYVRNKKHVVLLVDSITRITRAYNAVVSSSGRVQTGGIEPMALQKTKYLFGKARNTMYYGSLTILATALIETGSRFDDAVFEELKGTGNADVFLDRKLAQQNIYPSLSLELSSTRRWERMFQDKAMINNRKYLRLYLQSNYRDPASQMRALTQLCRSASTEEEIFSIIKEKMRSNSRSML
jgi:transcription termination factor Rho